MDKNDLLPFLKGNSLFTEFTDQEIGSLLSSTQVKTVGKGFQFFKEGETGDYLYIIAKGDVEIIKRDPESADQYHLATLQAGDWFGEMLLFEEGVRSATACAEGEVTVVEVSLKIFSSISKGMINLVKATTGRLRKTNEKAVASFKEELRLTKSHDHMGQFIIHLFILFTIYFYSFKIFSEYGAVGFFSEIVTSLLIVCFAVSAVVLVKKSKYPLSFYGLSLKNWRKNVYESVIFTLPVLVLILLMKWALIVSLPIFKDVPLFQIGAPEHSYFFFFHSDSARVESFFLVGLYLALVPIQEFIARGCLQSVLAQFFVSQNKVVLSILTSNLLFGMFHGFKTFTFALAAFTLGLFWGWLYARQKSIVGPTISHMLIGGWAFGCLNYQSILI
ncbi:MAG: cyclic nucleotide-binding domain-containing protein [Chlamydiota bacterium]